VWLDELREVVAERFPSWEIIAVNDRSTDGTAAILDDYVRRHPQVKVEHADANRGHGPTLRRALELSSGDWIFQVDSDKQFRASDFWALWERRTAVDLVLGVRAEREDRRHRLWLSSVVNTVVRLLGAPGIRDANIPFRLFTRELWLEAAPRLPADVLAPSISLVLSASLGGRSIAQVPVTHLAREHGPSSLRSLRLITFSLKGLFQLIAFRTRLGRSVRRTNR